MSRNNQVLVIGMGAVGTMVAYAIQSGGQADVTAVLRSNYQVVKEEGFTINSIDHGNDIRGWRPSIIRKAIPDLKNDPEQWYEYIVITTKNTPDVGPSLVDLVQPAVRSDATAIVLMQNGLNIEKPFQERFPSNTIISGIQMIGANQTAPGTILHNEADISHIGVFESDGWNAIQKETHLSRTKRFVDIYNACGKVNCQFDEDVKYTRWRKLVYNSSYNSISAILSMDVTRMRVYEHIVDSLIKPVMEEIFQIARAVGVQLPDELIMQFITIDSLESWFMPSMGQDAERNNFIEFETIVGEPMREAQKLNVPCPTLTVVYGLLKGVQTRIMESRGLLKADIANAGKYRGSKKH